MDPGAACAIAKKLGIKIYTVGIGSEEDRMFLHPKYGRVPVPKVNTTLLKKIARGTGGKFFMAHNAKDMRAIYDTIDSLEKTEHETLIYRNYHDIFMPFLTVVICLMIVEIILFSLVWFSI